MPLVDVVVVAYNSAANLRACIEPLTAAADLRVLVVDNASSDDGAATVQDLPVTLVSSPTNVGFAAGSNLGWRSGNAPYVLFLNPDASVDPTGVRALAEAASDPAIGAVAPRIVDSDGAVEYSQHRFPTLSSVLIQALLLDRIPGLGNREHGDVTDPQAYESQGSPDWVGGACLLLRRSTLEWLGGFDERFFMYAEDMDLCRRIRDLGLDVRFVPAIEIRHEGGASASAPRRSAMQMESRVLYARKHHTQPVAAAFVVIFSVGLVMRLLLDAGNRAAHAAGLRGVGRGFARRATT
jgi:N-acetylglucosaminyl-diphospho-decaprenol L-rhamnosyltransferase